MSGYTIGEIVVWLVLAAVLGFALGWLGREVRLRATRRRTDGRPPSGRTVRERTPAAEPVQPMEPMEEPAATERPEEPDDAEESDEPALADVPPARPGKPADPGAAPSPEHVIKGNTKSKIYHTPDSPSYARMTAGVWFRTEAEALDAGYRRPRNA